MNIYDIYLSLKDIEDVYEYEIYFNVNMIKEFMMINCF